MSYGTRIVGGRVEVASPRTGTVYSYEIPPGTSPAAYSLRCAERARVSECLAAIRVNRSPASLDQALISDQVREAAGSRRRGLPVAGGCSCDLTGGRGGEVEGGADAVLDERAGQAAGDRVGGLPAGAVGGDDHLGGELLQSADGVPDDRLEQRAGQVEAADDGVQLVDAGQALGVAADVDDARVPAAGEHDQPAPGDVGDQRLVVQDQRVGLPALAAPGLVDRGTPSRIR